jgi:hypothetical protein
MSLFRFSKPSTIPLNVTVLLYLGLSALGLSCLITSTSVLAAQITLAWDPFRDQNLTGSISCIWDMRVGIVRGLELVIALLTGALKT